MGERIGRTCVSFECTLRAGTHYKLLTCVILLLLPSGLSFLLFFFPSLYPSFLSQVELWIEFRQRVPRGKEVGVVPLTYRLGKPSGQDQADVAVGLMEEVKKVNGRRSCRSS